MNEQPPSQHAPEPASAVPRRRRFASPWRRICVYILFIYVVWCAALCFLQDWLIFPADAAPQPLSRVPYENAEVLRLDIDPGGQVEAWFVPAPGCDAAHPAPAVVFFHGNAELIDYEEPTVSAYHRLGVSVLLPEYRGYGRSGGEPSQAAIRADMIRFYDWLIRRDDVDASRVVFHGRSLGGGVAADLASERKPAALILQSTFSSLARMSRKYLAPGFLVRHPFRTDRVLRGLDVPVLIFHGVNDEIIPVRHARTLREVAPHATYVEYECAHNDFPGYGNDARYWSEIESFLRRNGIVRERGSEARSRAEAAERG